MAETRESFLERLRTSLAKGQTRAPEVLARPVVTQPALDDRRLVERFCQRAAEAGAEVSRVTSCAELRSRVVEINADLGARRVVRARAELLEQLDVDRALQDAGVELTLSDLRLAGSSPDGLRGASERADLGISQADVGLAETGTLVFRHRAGQGRALSLLPSSHLALVRTADLVADLEVLMRGDQSTGRDPGSALTFVTGPSRTADIEMVITKGVHGPGRLFVVVLDEEKEE